MAEVVQPAAQSEPRAVLYRMIEISTDPEESRYRPLPFRFTSSNGESFTGTINFPDDVQYIDTSGTALEALGGGATVNADFTELQAAVTAQNEILINLLTALLFVIAVLGILAGQGFVKLLKSR